MKKTLSIKYFKQAKNVMVGGVNSPVRAYNSVGGDPLIMQAGNGQTLYDIDANSYTDYCLSWGALILGHNHPSIRKTATLSLLLGSSFGTTTKPEIEIAQFLCRHVPSMDKVRFVNSGTEATMSAIRLSRAFTGRSKIIKFDGCYHGHVDDLLICAGSGVANLPTSSSQGIPEAHIKNTFSIPYNDINAFEQVIDLNHKEIACVIIEPVAGNMGVILPNKKFLETIRQLTKKFGIILIFDEVMCGFRSDLGCVQADMNITPDLTCLGKIIGGGFPVGAYGGRADIMDHLAPQGSTYQAGTFSGNPLVMRAGLATLKRLNKSIYKVLKSKSDIFVQSANQFFLSNKIEAHMVNYHSMISIRLTSKPVNNYSEAIAAAKDQTYSQLFHFLLKNNIYWPPANLETFFISTQHTTHDLRRLLNILKRFFTDEYRP